MVRAAPDSILGRSLSRDRRSERKNESEEKGGKSSEPKRSTGVQSRIMPLTESREENCKQHIANLTQHPAEGQRHQPAKDEAAATVRCPKPQPGEDPYLKQSVGTEAQPTAQHAAAQQGCEGQSVLTVRCKALEGAIPEAERTIMAGVTDREIETRGERGVPSLHEKPE